MALTSKIISRDYTLSFNELCDLANMSSDYLNELISYNIVKPLAGSNPQDWLFSSNSAKVIEKAIRLHKDLEIAWSDIALVVDLFDEIDQLEHENRQLKKQMNRLLAFKL